MTREERGASCLLLVCLLVNKNVSEMPWFCEWTELSGARGHSSFSLVRRRLQQCLTKPALVF